MRSDRQRKAISKGTAAGNKSSPSKLGLQCNVWGRQSFDRSSSIISFHNILLFICITINKGWSKLYVSCIEYEPDDFNARNINSIETRRIWISFSDIFPQVERNSESQVMRGGGLCWGAGGAVIRDKRNPPLRATHPGALVCDNDDTLVVDDDDHMMMMIGWRMMIIWAAKKNTPAVHLDAFADGP